MPQKHDFKHNKLDFNNTEKHNRLFILKYEWLKSINPLK